MAASVGVRRLHIMTDGESAYVARLKRALWDAAEWDSVSSTQDLVLNWEQRSVSEAVDALVAQRAHVFVGNGVVTTGETGAKLLLHSDGAHCASAFGLRSTVQYPQAHTAVVFYHALAYPWRPPFPPASRPMLPGFNCRPSGYRYTLLGVRTPTVSRTRAGFLVAGLVFVACVAIAVRTFVDFETFPLWPTPAVPSVNDLPPLYAPYHASELRLSQQDWNRTQPAGHEKYFFVSGFLIDVGWGNAFEEHLFNAYLAYRLGRTLVFANYTWRDDGSQYTHSFGHVIPSQIPYTALMRGPMVGEPWGPRYERVLPAVTKTYFDHICPSKTELHRWQVHSNLPYASDTEAIIDAWSKAVGSVDDPCVQTRKDNGAVFTHQETFGVPGNLASIWPDLISTPLLTRFAWSSLIELAFDVNRDLFLPSFALASTPYLSSLPYDSSTSTNAARYPPIPELMAIHVRKGDYASHCSLLATIGDPFVSVNNFPALPDAFLPPGIPGPVMPNGKVAGDWHATAAQRAYYRQRCYPSIPEIVAKVLEVRASEAGKGIRRLHIMTNGKPAYIANLKRALWDAAEWDAISSSRDLVLNWEQKFVAQAVDVLAAQRAQVLIGNGFSTLTSNAVIMRLANNFTTDSIRFW